LRRRRFRRSLDVSSDTLFCTSRPTAARTNRCLEGRPMSSMLTATAADLAVLDADAPEALPPLADSLRALFACRGDQLPVPRELINSVRAYRLSSLADAVERYNERFEDQGAMASA
jgi:hypothetical protein